MYIHNTYFIIEKLTLMNRCFAYTCGSESNISILSLLLTKVIIVTYVTEVMVTLKSFHDSAIKRFSELYI